MVVAIIALIVALSGTAYATGMLPKGSVGTLQLRPNSVSSTRLSTWAVTPTKIHGNSINSTKIVDGSLQASDFAPGQITAPAYARVNGGTAPTLVAEATKNFTKVTHASRGVYCVTPAAGLGLDPATAPAVAAPLSDSDPAGITVGQYVVWQPAATGCAAGDYVVRTYRIRLEAEGGPMLADDVSFSLIVG